MKRLALIAVALVVAATGCHEPHSDCSELVWWAAQGELRTGEHHRVITPSDLMQYGEVVYWSGQRTDQQVMDLAMARDAQPRDAQPQYASN